MRAAPPLRLLARPSFSPRGARKRERARVDLPSRQPVLGGDRRRRVLDRQLRQRLDDVPVERVLGNRRPRPAGPTTMTISPFGASPPAYSAASLSSAPRRTSSWSLVNSRATAALRGPSSSARSASVSARRPGDSEKMSVPGAAASALMRSRRADRLGGRNPSK